MDVLIDLDPAVYACGFASQANTYQIVYGETAELEIEAVESLKSILFSADADSSAGDKMKKWLNDRGSSIYVVDKSKLVNPEPLSYCLRIVSVHLDTIRAALLARFYSDSDAVRYHYFLSGSSNYRNSVAKQAKYKGNRLPESRPFHYASIRQYLEEKLSPHISSGNEADDEISIAAEKFRTQHRSTCVVSIDKDLDQIEGWHYNPDKKVFYQQDRDSALCYFYQQALSGDSTDNIPGCFRIGTERATSLMTSWTEDYESIGISEQQALWRNVVGIYIASTGKAGCPYTESKAESVAIETARLVYIQKADGELWNPPGEAFGRTDSVL